MGNMESGRSRANLEKINSLTDRSTPEQVLRSLLEGNQRFLDGASAHPHQDFARVQQISAKQTPKAAILGCADSRVPIEIMLDQGFGDVFVCRVAGNIATPEEIASLEYAVLDVGVSPSHRVPSMPLLSTSTMQEHDARLKEKRQ